MKKTYTTPVLKKIDSVTKITLGTLNQDTKDNPTGPSQRYIAS